jgi:DNA-binding transcriptional regulator YdaS (Cro superfamily)
MDALRRAVEIAGGQTALAHALGVQQAHVWNWLNRNKRLPAEYVIPVERATKGKVKRHELRPDIYPKGEAA